MATNNAEIVFDALKMEYEITEDTAEDVQWALSYPDEYAEYVREQAHIVIESINMGQSVLSLGELMRLLFNATHKLSMDGEELKMPGAAHFKDAAKVSSDALTYISDIAAITEEYATCVLSCNDTVDISYV